MLNRILYHIPPSKAELIFSPESSCFLEPPNKKSGMVFISSKDHRDQRSLKMFQIASQSYTKESEYNHDYGSRNKKGTAYLYKFGDFPSGRLPSLESYRALSDALILSKCDCEAIVSK
jgi:hypothetical protein